jgi:1-acyl-sn-glycerol-3-phosphate acyltransferase
MKEITQALPKYILTNTLGWKITGDFPNVEKSIIIFAPHTSYWDGFYGKLYFMQSGVNYKFLSKEEFFKFPMKYFFRAFGSIPVYKTSAYINDIVKHFENNKQLHIVLSPEGQLAKTEKWKKGFYYMAHKANVPIVIAYLDYQKKEVGIKEVIWDTNDMKETMNNVAKQYDHVMAKYPKEFGLDKRYNKAN